MWLTVCLIGAWTVINMLLSFGLAYWLLELSDETKETGIKLQKMNVRLHLLELDNVDVQTSVEEIKERAKENANDSTVSAGRRCRNNAFTNVRVRRISRDAGRARRYPKRP